MKAGHQALAVVQRPEGINAPLKPNIKVQVRAPSHMFLKQRKRYVVAGADRQQLMTLIARLGQNAGEIGAQRLDVRLHPRARATFGPEEPFGELRRTDSLSL